VAYAIFNDKHKKLSGWGFPQDDQGGGAWLGLQLISDMLQRIEGRKPETDLSRKLYNHLKRQGEDPMLWAVRAQPQKFGSLVPWLIEQAETDVLTQVYSWIKQRKLYLIWLWHY